MINIWLFHSVSVVLSFVPWLPLPEAVSAWGFFMFYQFNQEELYVRNDIV